MDEITGTMTGEEIIPEETTGTEVIGAVMEELVEAVTEGSGGGGDGG